MCVRQLVHSRPAKRDKAVSRPSIVSVAELLSPYRVCYPFAGPHNKEYINGVYHRVPVFREIALNFTVYNVRST